jgi:hypothetical protein
MNKRDKLRMVSWLLLAVAFYTSALTRWTTRTVLNATHAWNNQRDKLRMVSWLLLAVAFYTSAIYCTQPQIQTGLWKMGHITMGAFVGYWADRHLLGAITYSASQGRMISRAIIVAAAIIGMASGL